MDRVAHCTWWSQKIYDPAHYRVVFFSSAPIGVPFLHTLCDDKRFEVVGVVTMPDAPSGRGMKMQENVIKVEAKKYLEKNMCRYFLLIDSLHKNWKNKLQDTDFFTYKNHEDRGIIIYANKSQHEKTVHILQSLLQSWPRYFDSRWAYNLIIYKEHIFDLQKWESDKAKVYGRSLGIPEEQLDRSTESNEFILNELIQTPQSLRSDSKKYAPEAGIFQQRLIDKKPDYIVVIAYGKIIPQAILDIPTIVPINVHGSLLPKYRGASPLQSVFLNNEEETGITIMKMNAGLDTGDMIDKIKFRIPFDWTVKNVIEKMQEVGPKFLVDTLWKYGKKMLGEVKQNESEVTVCGKIEKENWLIDPYADALVEIYPKYRAFYLWPKVYFNFKGMRVIIEELQLNEKEYFLGKDLPLLGEDNVLPIAVEKLLVKPEWKKSMLWEEFVNGYIK